VSTDKNVDSNNILNIALDAIFSPLDHLQQEQLTNKNKRQIGDLTLLDDSSKDEQNFTKPVCAQENIKNIVEYVVKPTVINVPHTPFTTARVGTNANNNATSSRSNSELSLNNTKTIRRAGSLININETQNTKVNNKSTVQIEYNNQKSTSQSKTKKPKP
jgi:hypothetical protein